MVNEVSKAAAIPSALGLRPLRNAMALLSCTLAVACGDGPTDGPGGSPATGLAVSGVVKNFEPNVERQKFATISGVEVCIYGHAEVDCDTTSSSGTFALAGVPADSNLLVSFEKKGYAKAFRMLSTRKEDYDILAETVLAKLTVGIAQAQMNGVDLNTFSGGAVQFFAANPGDGVLEVALLSNYSATLENIDGTPAVCGGPDGDAPCKPLYLDETGEPDPTLKASTRTGVGAFGNVAPGKYVLSISHPELACDQHLPESGWPAEQVDAVVVKVVDEWVTSQVGVFCQPPE
jgi:hypothetical protein